jgi:hypothetical protein
MRHVHAIHIYSFFDCKYAYDDASKWVFSERKLGGLCLQRWLLWFQRRHLHAVRGW